MQELHGYSADSLKRLIQGVGHAYANIDVAPLRDAAELDPATAALAAVGVHDFGATQGGLNFSVTPQYSDLNLDGIRSSTKNNKRFTHNEVTLGFSIAEFGTGNLLRALDQSQETDIGNGLLEIREKVTTCAWPEYIDNVAFTVLFGDCDETVPAIFVVYNVLNDAGISIATQDEDIATSQVNFMGHYDPADAERNIYSIFVPKPTA